MIESKTVISESKSANETPERAMAIYRGFKVRGRRVEFDFLEVVAPHDAVADDVEVDAVVVLEGPLPAQVERVLVVAGQVDDDRRTGAADVGALDDGVGRLALVLPRERLHADLVLRIRLWKRLRITIRIRVCSTR